MCRHKFGLLPDIHGLDRLDDGHIKRLGVVGRVGVRAVTEDLVILAVLQGHIVFHMTGVLIQGQAKPPDLVSLFHPHLSHVVLGGLSPRLIGGNRHHDHGKQRELSV